MRRIRVTRDNEAPPAGETPADEAAAGDTAADDQGTVIDLTAAIAERGEGNADAALAAADAAAVEGEEEPGGPIPFEQLEPLIESLLFASDRPLSVADLKRLTGERDSRLINEALRALTAKRADSGIQLLALGGGFALRTNPAFADWVGKLLAAKPVRLSRAMLETLSIVAYRQPITRPEIDDIRGVDCGPVLKTLLDRNLIRIIGKKRDSKANETGRNQCAPTAATLARGGRFGRRRFSADGGWRGPSRAGRCARARSGACRTGACPCRGPGAA
jgi:segregation and condensation protein B